MLALNLFRFGPVTEVTQVLDVLANLPAVGASLPALL